MASKELERINNKYDIVVQPVTKEKKGISFADVVFTPLMVSSPVIVPVAVGMALHPILGFIVTPVAFFASGLWSTFRTMKVQYDTSTHHDELVERSRNKYSGHDLLVPISSNTHNKNNNGFFSHPLVDSVKSMISPYVKNSNRIEHEKPKVGLKKIFKSLFKKQSMVHMVEGNGWAVVGIYKYRFMRLVEVEEHAFISPEIEWEKGFNLCVEVIR